MKAKPPSVEEICAHGKREESDADSQTGSFWEVWLYKGDYYLIECWFDDHGWHGVSWGAWERDTIRKHGKDISEGWQLGG